MKQSYKLLIWFLIILLMIFLECEKYIYFVDNQRSNIDLIFNLICKISKSRTTCKVLICRMLEIDRLFSSVCRMIDESVAIARILQETYDLFVNMIDLNIIMHQISTNFTNHKQNLDFQIERFKVIQDDLAIFDDVKMKFLENQKYIYNTLLLMSNYLMRFYDHVNDVANVILFEINVITNDIAQIIDEIVFRLEALQVGTVDTVARSQRQMNFDRTAVVRLSHDRRILKFWFNVRNNVTMMCVSLCIIHMCYRMYHIWNFENISIHVIYIILAWILIELQHFFEKFDN